HSDFHGRARYPSDLTPPGPDKNLNDDNGHGTHVAGIVGSSTYGVAKSVNIIAVKVLGANGRGAWSGVIAGIDYVVKKFKALRRHSIINISISGPRNAALNQALDAAANQGVHVVVASGNDGKDACTTSPGSARNVISVGASTATDAVADFSNFGSCVTLVAPGNSILSVGTGSPSASRYMSGTSMASPHVTGALAVILSEQPKLVAPSVLRRYIISLASKNVLRADNPGSRDLLYLPSNPI
ncbi:serine protease, partial [Coelomomyces lativittatus]